MPREHTTNDKTYRANRKQLLADNPLCHWCQTAVATTADHVVPYVEGGSHDIENLVPACRPCNSSRGAKVGNQRRAYVKGTAETKPRKVVKAPASNAATNEQMFAKPSDFFDSSSALPPHALSRISQKPLSVVGRGHDCPRLETITPATAPNRSDEIVGFARDVMGVELFPWQIRVCAGLTAMDDDGNYLRRIGLTSVARQNGKTVIIAALIGWFLTVEAPRRGTPQTVVSVAHKLDLATATFKYLAPMLEARYGAKVSWSYGRSELTVAGHRWLCRAATPQAGHGYSVDLVVVDEVWNVSEDAIDEGLLPTQRARRNPLFVMFSTAGTQHSEAMIRWRSQGLRQIDAGEIGPMYFAEWSPPAGMDPMSPEAWGYANPALGYTLDMSVLETESKAPNRSAFLRSSVNLWVAASTGWLEPGLFDTLATDEAAPPGGVLAVESSVDSAHYVGVRAVQRADHKTVATVEFQVESLAAMWQAVEAALDATPSLRLAIPPTLELSCPPKWERRRVIVGFRELGRWTAAVRSTIIEGRLAHTGELSLTEHVERAVMVKHQGTVTLSSARSPGPIELARCLVFAVALASKPAETRKPVLVVAKR